MQRPIRPDWLIRQADELGGRVAGPGQPRNADLRRAVSIAYYALFHHLTLAVAATVLAETPGDQQLAYTRRVSHSQVTTAAKWITGAAGGPVTARPFIDPLAADPDVVDIAQAFLDLKEAREAADYDHLTDFRRGPVLAFVALSRDCIEKFDALPPDQRSRFVAAVLATK